ncbi:hypothetical protein ACSD7O_17470 [Methylorubrum extorquens]|uniref:hypothetical protein n=1 Tax=Methylorubrum extorquens TaxID=408 RepID=UPI003F622911
MSEKPPLDEAGSVTHLPRARKAPTREETFLREMELAIASQFREQNDLLRESNREQAARIREQGERLQDQGERLKEQGEMVRRLTRGVELLVGELQGVRTGQREEAFARVGDSGCSPDLPTVSAEAALVYTHTARTIGDELGFGATQVGILLGAKGLRWAGNGDFQEMGRPTGPGQSKFWHRDVPARLRAILDENNPGKYGIVNGTCLSVFRRWQARKAEAKLRDEPSGTQH